MVKIIEGNIKIRFQDCDPFNHLNNSKYIDYFINVREDLLIENYNFNFYEIAKNQGVSWVTGSNQISYLKPANTNEIVTIQSQIIKVTPISTLVEFRMYNKAKTELKSIMWSKFIHISMKTKRAIQHSKDFSKLFDSICLPVKENLFEERVQALMKLKKNDSGISTN